MMSKYAEVYYDPEEPGSFGGVEALRRRAGGTRKDAEKWLKKQDTYTLHRPVKKRFPRNKILVAGLDDQWSADLIDVHGLAKFNNNNTFLLTVVDTLSKYAWVVPLKDKTGSSVVNAFKKIFKERTCRKLFTDAGKEFLNAKFQSLLKSKGIIFFTSRNETKVATIERFNRTLMSKMWRYFTATGQKRYIDVLPKLVHSYNGSKHASIGVAPASVNAMNAETVWRKLYKFRDAKKTPKYQIGDLVRISKAKKTFEKGYKTNWTKEVFEIKRVHPKTLPEYSIQDLNGEDILGKFLEAELQPVEAQKSQTFRIDKVIRSTGRGNSKKSLVSWEGFSPKFDSWIPANKIPLYQ